MIELEIHRIVATVTRHSHSFEIAVSNSGDIVCRINGRHWFAVSIRYDHQCSSHIVAFDPPVTLEVSGGATKCGGVRITPEQFNELTELSHTRRKATSDEIIRQARNSENNYVLSVDLDTCFGGLTISAWKRLPSGSYVDELTIAKLPELSLDDVPAGFRLGDCVNIITAVQCDTLIALNESRKTAREEAEEEYRREKAELISKVDSWNMRERTITDEFGKTELYIHTFIVGGKKMTYIERNVFDAGIVINPSYWVAPNVPESMLSCEDGVYYWADFKSGSGWYTVRELTSDETNCINIILKYGGHANAHFRM